MANHLSSWMRLAKKTSESLTSNKFKHKSLTRNKCSKIKAQRLMAANQMKLRQLNEDSYNSSSTQIGRLSNLKTTGDKS